MFCMHCGLQIPDNAKFCSGCGVQLNNLQNNNQALQSPDKAKVLNKYSYRNGSFGFTIFQIILEIIMIVLFFILLFLIDNWEIFKGKNGNKFISSYIPDSSAKDILIYLKVFFILGIVFNIIMLFIKIAKASAISSTFLCITESGIFGIGGTESYLGNKKMTVYYHEITSVKKQTGCVMVDSTAGNCKFLVDNDEEAVNEINRRMIYVRARESLRYY